MSSVFSSPRLYSKVDYFQNIQSEPAYRLLGDNSQATSVSPTLWLGNKTKPFLLCN